MREPDDRLSDDEELRTLLRSWEVEGAPPHLAGRVLEGYRSLVGRPRWWRKLLAMPVRLPAPVAVALAALLLALGYLAGRGTPVPGSAPPPPEMMAAEAQVARFPLMTQTQLAGFQPLDEVKVEILRKEETHER
jgi:hypothetical protein